MAIFKCLTTGNTVEFTQEHDIEAMKSHHQYELVVEKPKEETKKPEVTKEGK